jgi:hypothetical protein
VLIDGTFKLNEITELPRRFTQAYAFIYAVQVLKTERFDGYAWRGDGYSSMHFYKGILRKLPWEARPQVKTLQYASPGFITFSLFRPAAVIVGTCVERVMDAASDANVAFKDLQSYIRNNKLNDLKARDKATESSEWEQFNPKLLSKTKAMLDSLSIDSSAFLDASPGVFEASKIALSFFARIRDLADLCKDGLVKFPAK